MSKFPQAIPLPKEVYQSRANRNSHMVKGALQGVGIRSIVIIAELYGYFIFHSSALLMDAISSLFDVASSLLIILCIKFAARPADKNHPYGHGRFEPLGGFQLGLAMMLIGVWMGFGQVAAIGDSAPESTISRFAWIIPCGAVVLLELCYQIIIRIAKKTNSAALAADAVHYRIDGVNSLFAAIALAIGAYRPEWSNMCDHIGALAIITLMIGLGFFACKSNLDQLLDRVPDQEYFDLVRRCALAVPGVRETEKIGIQLYGPNAHVNIDIEIDPDCTVDIAHQISQKVRSEIQQEWPAVQDVIVHIEPYYAGDH